MIKDLMNEMESSDLRYRLGYASTIHALIHRIEESPLVRKAQTILACDPTAAQEVLQRANHMRETDVEEGYLHPEDLILATYLFLLRRNPSASVGELIREMSAGAYPGFQGATGIAQVILEGRSSATQSVLKPSAGLHIRPKSPSLCTADTGIDYRTTVGDYCECDNAPNENMEILIAA